MKIFNKKWFSPLLAVFLSLFLVSCDSGSNDERKPVPKKVTEQKVEKGQECAHLSPWGFPQFNPPQANTRFLCHSGYALEFNPRSKTPMWVVEHLTRQNLAVKVASRQDDFRPDPDLPEDVSAKLSDYVGSGFDRGHMAPAEDFRGNAKQMSESFYLSNMIPQDPNNNRGIWAQLEKVTRYWAVSYNEVYVITGPIYQGGSSLGFLGHSDQVRLMGVEQGGRGLDTVKKGRIAIPTHIYKVIYAPKFNQAIGFIIPNSPANVKDLPKYRVPVSTVEYYTGLSFFPQWPATNVPVKSQIPLWPIKTK